MIRSRIATGAILALFASGAVGTEYEYGIAVGVGSSDNISRVPTDEQSETIAMAGLDLRLFREGSRIDANVDADLSYFDYLGDTFDSEVLGRAFVDFRARIVPDHFEWVLTDGFGQLSLNPFDASNPANRENVNYLTTGPDLRMRIGSQGSLTTFGRYSMSHYEESNIDDQRLLGGISLARELSPSRIVSLNAVTERVEFDDPALSNYDRTSGFLRYEIDGARTRIAAEAGYTEIHDANETDSGPLLEIEIVRDFSERSRVTLRGGVRTSDQASALIDRDSRGSCMPRGYDPTSSADLFETRHATLCWQSSALRTDIMLWARYEQDEYESDSRLDRRSGVYQAFVRREITPRLSLSARVTLSSYDFTVTDQEDDETGLGLYLSWNAIGRLYVEVAVENFNRDSSNALTEYEETRTFLRLAWRDRAGSWDAR